MALAKVVKADAFNRKSFTK